ncbi:MULTISPECIES: substrate-binding periplasmic protein [Pseudoalteromonas]|uniref:substrate-binding periplasmic protein n=1 Tax=Pseudoalteromonas TaxID=53246 RepID=UPI000FFEBEA7|nr:MULTISPECIES: transporter substrate-binding domain-containing protein [Pseudoalteromonas]NKC21374.1 transporter substrate-binding domain-containing protein [Pseudoalteromonas galatheae]RXE85871.1 amino acid ABC transporter substrate-binding protein [Pseudoalteromonas sp. A757]
MAIKSLRQSCLLFLAVSFITPVNASSIVGAHNIWPPYIIDERSGFSVDLVRAAFEAENQDFEMLTMPFSRAMRMVENGQVDIIPALWRSNSRDKRFVFSEPYYSNRLVLISHAESDIDFESLEDLKGLSVCAIRGFRSEIALAQISQVRLEKLTNLSSCLSLLNKQRVEAVVSDELAFAYLRAQYDEFHSLKVHQSTIAQWPLHIGISKSNPKAAEVIELFNKGLLQLKVNGIYKATLKKYRLDE